MADTRVQPAITYTAVHTAPRVTPPPGHRRFREALGGGAQALLAGVEGAAAFVPGAPLATAAVRRPSGGIGVPGAGPLASPEAPAGPTGAVPSLVDGLQGQADQSLRFLQLQEQISAENRRFSALSNVLKARHDTAKSAINNIK
jgi:hypothetical protein